MVWRPDAHDDVLRDGQAASLLLPMLFGPPYADWALPGWGKAGGYFGVAEVCLGLACVCNVRALTRIRLLALGWSIFWLAAFLGEPITRLIWMALPGLNQAVLTRYGMPSLEFLWAMLAAMAVDEWRAGRLRFGRPALAVLAVGAGAIIECVAIRRLPGELNLQLLGYVWLTILWSLAIVGLLALITHRTAGRGRLAAILGLLAADAVLPFAVPISAGMVSWQMDLTPVRFLAAQPGYPRIFGIGSRLSPNYGSYFNLSTIRSFFFAGAGKLGTRRGADASRTVRASVCNVRRSRIGYARRGLSAAPAVLRCVLCFDRPETGCNSRVTRSATYGRFQWGCHADIPPGRGRAVFRGARRHLQVGCHFA